MSDPNKICWMCTDGKNSTEFTLCPECRDKLANGWVGGKCSRCHDYTFLPRDKKTIARVQHILDSWNFFVRPGICAYKASAVVDALMGDEDSDQKKAVIIYSPNCPKCYRKNDENEPDPNHPLTILKYKIACFSVDGLQMHSLKDEPVEAGGIRILH